MNLIFNCVWKSVILKGAFEKLFFKLWMFSCFVLACDWHVSWTRHPLVSSCLHMYARGQRKKIPVHQSGQWLCHQGPIKTADCAISQWRAGIECCVCINTLCDCSVLINVISAVRWEKTSPTHTALTEKRKGF